MSDFITFHKSVMGYLHEQKQKPCQDCSGDYNGEEEGKPYYIAVIADGHGSSACPRSEVGSKKIVEIVLEDFKEFAKTMLKEREEADGSFGIYEQFAIPKYQRQMMKTLTDSIVSKWKKAVIKHLNSNLPSEEEIEKSGEFYAEQYRRREHLEHLYGTTVIAALRLPDYFVLIQQGDGRCDVFYEDNTVNQPIPWDPRCHENITTSMCDVDVLQSIRSNVILLKEKSVIACYMGSDGVEDSYIDSSLEKNDKHYMEGTHMFYRNITCQLLDCYEKVASSKEKCKSNFENDLENQLPKFSETGSGDDVSVSGIVDLEKAKQFKEAFKKNVIRYNLQDELRQWEEKLGSMERKYGILEQRANKIRSRKEEVRKECEEVKRKKKELEEEKTKLKKKKEDTEGGIEEYCNLYNDLKKAWEGCRTLTEKIEVYNTYINPTNKLLDSNRIGTLVEDRKRFYKEKLEEKVKEKKKQGEKLKDLEAQIQKQKEHIQEVEKKTDELEKDPTYQEFIEYKAKYEELKNKIVEIKEKMNKNEIGSL